MFDLIDISIMTRIDHFKDNNDTNAIALKFCAYRDTENGLIKGIEGRRKIFFGVDSRDIGDQSEIASDLEWELITYCYALSQIERGFDIDLRRTRINLFNYEPEVLRQIIDNSRPSVWNGGIDALVKAPTMKSIAKNLVALLTLFDSYELTPMLDFQDCEFLTSKFIETETMKHRDERRLITKEWTQQYK